MVLSLKNQTNNIHTVSLILYICSNVSIECPTGYKYVGDDGTPQHDVAGRIIGECGESPTYSCYKAVTVTDINDALGQCYKSVMDSDNMEARVVSFDDDNELFRVFKYFYNLEEKEGQEQTVLTSAMKFAVEGSEHTWIYLGTSRSQYNQKT